MTGHGAKFPRKKEEAIAALLTRPSVEEAEDDRSRAENAPALDARARVSGCLPASPSRGRDPSFGSDAAGERGRRLGDVQADGGCECAAGRSAPSSRVRL